MDTLALTTDMQLVLGLVALVMVLFLFERVRADLVALVVLVVLGLTGLVAPEDEALLLAQAPDGATGPADAQSEEGAKAPAADAAKDAAPAKQ